MKTNTTRSGRLLVPIVTVLYVILSAAGLIFFRIYPFSIRKFSCILPCFCEKNCEGIYGKKNQK